jgi:alpha-1,3-glucan synthase
LITIGPVIDLYGKFAALKLEKLMQKYPKRVYSKPEFTALPPYIFSGAEFALIPSRDEPFGLVAVEFGRKGALGIGARVGGLGNMPGWWYTVESPTVQHLTKQLQQAVEEALACKKKIRAKMRAQSALQRFPVKAWVEDLEVLQSASIRIHNAEFLKGGVTTYAKAAQRSSYRTSASTAVGSAPATPTRSNSLRVSKRTSLQGLGDRLRSLKAGKLNNNRESFRVETPNVPTSVLGPGHSPSPPAIVSDEDDQLNFITALPPIPKLSSLPEDIVAAMLQQGDGGLAYYLQVHSNDNDSMTYRNFSWRSLDRRQSKRYSMRSEAESFNDNASYLSASIPLRPTTRPTTADSASDWPLCAPESPTGLLPLAPAPVGSTLSLSTVIGQRTDYHLQKLDAFFTDSTGEFYAQYEKRLADLNGSNSASELAIEDFLIRSERKWFDKYRSAKLGMLDTPSRPVSMGATIRSVPPTPRKWSLEGETPKAQAIVEITDDEFSLGKDYVPIRGLKRYMMVKIGDWPVYAFLLAFGQILSANSYQVTLLTGEIGQQASRLYAIASIYLATSILWWYMFRRCRSVTCLSFPFFLFGLAFTLIGTAHFADPVTRRWMQNVGAGLYSAASSSGYLFFALNFGDEGGTQVPSWVFRACTIQGTQQLYVAALWYWGSTITRRTAQGTAVATDMISTTWRITAITVSIAVLLWIVGCILFLGLPKYYHQTPGQVASFYTSIARKKVVLWFLFTVIIQNFFLANPYGRNWSFLFSSTHAKTWQVVCLMLLFFIGVWCVVLWIFGRLSRAHAWLLPLFAIGLGAPRWAQIWWGVSGLGLWLPWTGGPTASALLSRSIWLWLGTLDSIQGVGIGMILLGTLTRVHVAFTLAAAQVVGSLATIVARTAGPNRLGPGPISPDITGGLDKLWNAWFWIGLALNLSVCGGFYKFYRKEQLQKP